MRLDAHLARSPRRIHSHCCWKKVILVVPKQLGEALGVMPVVKPILS